MSQEWVTDRDPIEHKFVEIRQFDWSGEVVSRARRVDYKPGSKKSQLKAGWRWIDIEGNVIKKRDVEGWRPLYSEPHQVQEPTTVKQIKALLDRNDPEALGELQRLAIGFRLATLRTDCESVRRRMIKFIDGLGERHEKPHQDPQYFA